MTRERLKYAACQAAGYLDGSRESRVAEVALNVALDNFPGPAAYLSMSRRDGVKERKRETKELFRATKAKTIATIQADPQAYGFGPIAMWFLWFIVGKIVERIVEWLMQKRYSTGGDGEIQAAVAARTQ